MKLNTALSGNIVFSSFKFVVEFNTYEFERLINSIALKWSLQISPSALAVFPLLLIHLSCFGGKIDYGSGSLWCVKLEAIRAPSNAFFPFSSGLKLVIQKHESGILTLQVSVIMAGDRLVVESSLPNVWVLLWKLRLYTVF